MNFILALLIMGLVCWMFVKLVIYVGVTQPHRKDMKKRKGGF